MTAKKYTQGPWRYWSCRIDSRSGMEDYLQFANLQGHVFRAPISYITESDARLICAAPDLLEALQFVMSAHGEQLDLAFEQAQKAIAKATGETI